MDSLNLISNTGQRYTITDSDEFGDISLTLEEMSDKKLLMSERHYFYIAGDIVYHLWFDAMEMNWADDKQMLESIWIKESYMPTVPSDDIITDSRLIQYGTFRNVYVQTNVFMNNAISKTESIVSLDSELVEAEIQKEHQNAIG